jgi:hypothetical protein
MMVHGSLPVVGAPELKVQWGLRSSSTLTFLSRMLSWSPDFLEQLAQPVRQVLRERPAPLALVLMERMVKTEWSCLDLRVRKAPLARTAQTEQTEQTAL